MVYCFRLFDIGFLLGDSPYQENPRGVVGNSWADIPAALSGYVFFQHDSWRLPIFHVTNLGAPTGLNIIFTDSIPSVALAGQLAFHATGATVNLYGVWTAMCFVASAVTMTGLVATLGQRNLAAAAMATVAGLTMPALLARWGHMSLMAQFEIPLALIFYLRNRNSGAALKTFGQAAGLSLLTLWTQSYLFVMVIGIVFATVARRSRTVRSTTRPDCRGPAGRRRVFGRRVGLSGHLMSSGALAAIR